MRVPPTVICDMCGWLFYLGRVEISATESGCSKTTFTPSRCPFCKRKIVHIMAETKIEEKYRAIVRK